MSRDESVIVRCSHCGAKNRIPGDRMRERPVCGKCRNPLPLSVVYPEHPLDITDGSFATEVLNFPGSVMVFCWAPWCPHCQRLLPLIDELASAWAGRVKFTKLLLEQNPRTASHYSIQSVPTFLLFQKGKMVNRLVGALPKQELERYLLSLH